MNKDDLIEIVQELLKPVLAANPEHFLVEIKVKPTNNIKVYVDGDKGVGIDELVRYNRSLYRQLEEKALFPEGDFSLEVSSPGLDEPLKMQRQFVKNTGRDVEVLLHDGTVITGKLVAVTDDTILVEETKAKPRAAGAPAKNKKAETVLHTLASADIKTTKVQIKF